MTGLWTVQRLYTMDGGSTFFRPVFSDASLTYSPGTNGCGLSKNISSSLFPLPSSRFLGRLPTICPIILQLSCSTAVYHVTDYVTVPLRRACAKWKQVDLLTCSSSSSRRIMDGLSQPGDQLVASQPAPPPSISRAHRINSESISVSGAAW